MKTPHKLVCDGDCEHHIGEVVSVKVKGWGVFNYCEEAIADDRRRGFEVTKNEDKEVMA